MTTDSCKRIIQMQTRLNGRMCGKTALSERRIICFSFYGKGDEQDLVRISVISKKKNCEKQLLASPCLSVRSAPTKYIFTKFDIWVIFKNVFRKLKFHQNPIKMTGTLYEDLCTFITISRWIPLRMINVSDQLAEKIKTHILCSIIFFRKSCRFLDNVGKNTAQRDRPQKTIQYGACACWIPNATDTHSEYVTLIGFPPHQQLRERASMLLLHVHCLSCL